ncbi:MAG: DUF1499 domain-containing protein [Chloroflexaceae bacterium]|nr:DUF1499 domain-containing protein [Chloroflexaceae bacterium]
MFNFSGKRPQNLGVKDGQLASPPGTPNCVSSQSQDPRFRVDPLPLVTISEIKMAIAQMERGTVVAETEDYLYAEFKSKLMGFVDDVEFYRDATAGVVHVRSASRLGQSDLGVNRQRIEALRALVQP